MNRDVGEIDEQSLLALLGGVKGFLLDETFRGT